MAIFKTSLAGVLAVALCSTPLVAQAWEKDRTYKFTVLHTNDHHGRFWPNAHDEYGLAAQKTMMDQIRNEVQTHGGATLILSGGDINTGVPESDLQDAEPDFRAMNMIGYDAMAIGNHEFDNPLSVLRQQQRWAKFPLLSANIYQKSTGKRLFQPYALFNRMGLKIAVIGLTTDDTAKIGNPEYFEDVLFHKPATEAKAVVEELRAHEKPDVIIAATHMGHYNNGQHGSNAPGDVEMARALPAGYLDMIVGGHSQDPVCMAKENLKQVDYVPGSPCTPDRQNGTWIVQAHEWGKYIGRADFTLRNGKLTLVNYQLIPINLKHKVKNADGSTQWVNYTAEIAKNPGVQKLLTPFQKKGEAQLGVKIGSVNAHLEGDRSKVRFVQTNMARLILAGLTERTHADFALMSGGGVRDSIEAGAITYKDVLKVQPFGNTVARVDMKGSEIEKYLAVVANKQVDSGAYAQFYGVSLVADGSGVSHIKIHGKPLLADKTYRMAMLSFNATGGDGYPPLDKLPGYVNTGFVDAEVLKQYIQSHSPLDAANYQPGGEIVYLKTAAKTAASDNASVTKP
ncbi:bifunctional UDP-sugar hydrolase/5'-nucleotidase UshA [Erwinia amylovora]|uniref:Bifunctional UDP-sugar hydrolase/5'-nucleotidase periplasmic n=3 Tax=Erwinia amylovora TaxID=552 RepID=A0A831EPR2_ERWAM|nr:bifunctional UDP-sugar hydrolase/5'-nucleotidase UshA [Erwinia amylovora]CDK14592.1 bifunctional UDP-sugar hydrolase/5'-nucleotidase periplasmic precursor [Erwinia amylovora LA635]CDK17960.1 bifunctional UDP-sugar hydrolase/5'-nucleotidase periplasmic precursor [Erwinia amylovora LA636]CDK21329.1 bifunctional UDP-sugar hydrolase/5'-nucleotidase periplasmic precursor [Erwinia amylovora LA637]ATZ10926.1 bifunctional UDP-sugar hydrolase/5'-nucleotidase [Erwinia amylovora]EKV53742.1 bifunctiona